MNALIIEDHEIVRIGLNILLKTMFPAVVVIQKDSLDDGIKCIREQHFELLILDVNLPGGNSIDMIEAVYLRDPKIKILVFSSYNEDMYAMRFLQAGVNGYVNKMSSTDELKKAIYTVLSGGIYASNAVQKKLLDNTVKKKQNQEHPFATLSNREMDVANLIMQGSTTYDIANMLNLKASTISTYKLRIFEKLNIENTIELINKFKIYNVYNDFG